MHTNMQILVQATLVLIIMHIRTLLLGWQHIGMLGQCCLRIPVGSGRVSAQLLVLAVSGTKQRYLSASMEDRRWLQWSKHAISMATLVMCTSF